MKRHIGLIMVLIVCLVCSGCAVTNDQSNKYKSLSPEKLSDLNDDDLLKAMHEVLYYNFEDEDFNKLNAEQRTILTLINFDNEVQNGGLCQFFVNSSRLFAPYTCDSLEAVGAVELKNLFETFIAANNIDVYHLESFKIDSIDDYEKQTLRYPFDKFDHEFYNIRKNENITELMIQYTRNNLTTVFHNNGF